MANSTTAEPSRLPGRVARLRVQLFADGADLAGMIDLAALPHVAGLTTNPSLVRGAGVTDYRSFARELLAAVPDKPVSLEVPSGDLHEMERESREIASWGPNVFVKVPAVSVRGLPTYDLVRRLAAAGVRQNVTAVMTRRQVWHAAEALGGDVPAFVSVFAGRIADTGLDPVPEMADAVRTLAPFPNQRLIWASPRELFNVFQADGVGCHVITLPPALLGKLPLVGKDLDLYSIETVRTFCADARAAGLAV